MIKTERKPLLQWTEEEFQRWSSMPRLSLVSVPRTKFLFLKTPLSTVYEEKYGDRNVFTVSMYVHRLIAKNIDVGLVIDCSYLDSMYEHRWENTFSATTSSIVVSSNHDHSGEWYYYNQEDWDDFGIDYKTLGTISDRTLSSEILQTFMNMVQEHWKKHPNLHIALLDNRGGHGLAAFLAAYYLCRKLKASVHVALDCVKVAVPFKDTELLGCFDVQLVRLLQETFLGKQELVMNLEKLPQWWHRKTDIHSNKMNEGIVKIPPFTKRDLSDVDHGDHDDTKASKRKVGDQSTTLFEVLSPESQRCNRVLTVMNQMTSESCLKTVPIKSLHDFNGPDDTSKMNTNYKVTWSSVGRRGLLLVLSDGIYFLENSSDNENLSPSISMLKCPLYFPNPQKPTELQHRTLMDVTLVMDKEGNKNVLRLYIYDLLVHMGGILLKKPFHTRLKYIIDGIILPRKKTTTIWNYENELIRVRAQEYFDVSKATFVASEVIPAQFHDVIGVLFLSGDGAYNDHAFVANLGDNGLPEDLIEKIGNLND